MANKKRSTRRAFGRRALAFGVAMFAMVTLTAVGFAAWLISTNSTAQGTGGIVTQSVSQANIEIVIDNINEGFELVGYTGSPEGIDDTQKYDIVYAAPANANGLITWTTGESGQDKPESLTFSFTGKIKNAHRVGVLNFSVKVPDSIIAAAGFTKGSDGKWGNYNAANAYVELPSYAVDYSGNPIPKIENSSATGSDTEKISFANITDLSGASLTSGPVTLSKGSNNEVTFVGRQFTFKWGARYNNTNPATLINEGRWNEFNAATGLSAASHTTNQIQLELLKLQAVVNNVVSLDTYFSNEMKADMGSKTLDDYVKEGDQTKVQTYLAEIQTAMSAVIYADGYAEKPTYKLFIEANVRSGEETA